MKAGICVNMQFLVNSAEIRAMHAFSCSDIFAICAAA